MSIPVLEFPVVGTQAIYRQYRALSSIALKMQTAGWRVDRAAVNKHKKAAEARRVHFERIFSRLSGVKNLGKNGNTDDVRGWFWDVKGASRTVSIDKHTGKPKLDTNGALMNYLTESEDQELRDASAALIGYRKAGKTLEFCDAYAVDRVHPTFNVTGTKGSRWSCSGPNVQQLPSKKVQYDFGNGPEVVAVSMKDILTADEGFVLVDADYSALELYLQTYLAGAEKLIECIKQGRDLHLFNAQVFFGAARVPDNASKKTNKAEREVAKLAYGLSYNVSDHIATTFKQMKAKAPELTEKVVQEFRNRYFRAHPEFLAWQKRTIAQIESEGRISTPILGRELILEHSTRGHNQAMNAQCQITGGDLMNAAIIGLDAELNWESGEQIRAQVHDSLVLQVRDNPAAIDAAKELLVRHMGRPTEIFGRLATFVVEPSHGRDWATCAG